MTEKCIVVTGASSGLGRALATSYAARGVRLGLVGRHKVRLDEVAAACAARGSAVTTALIDVTNALAMELWLNRLDSETPLDLVIAAAGISGGPPPGVLHEGQSLATQQVATNLLGAINTIEPLLPAMLARGRGHIALVSSIAGLRGLPYSPGYSASKAGIRAYGEGLRASLRRGGLTVSVVVPGFFDSPMTDRFKGSKPFLMSAVRAAEIVRHGLDRRRSRIVFPRLLALGLQAADLLPAPIGDAILRSVHFHIVPP